MKKDSYTAAEYKALIEASKKKASDRRIQQIHKQFTDWLTCNGLAFVREYQFDKANNRKWRIDYYLSELNLAIEVEGGVWSGGRHVRGKGFLKDMDKYNAITVAGIKLLRIDTDRLNSLYFRELVIAVKGS